MPKSEEELDRLSCTSVERPVKSSGMLISCYLSAISRAKILQTVLLKSISGKIELSLSGEFSEIRFVLGEHACRALRFRGLLLHRRGMFRAYQRGVENILCEHGLLTAGFPVGGVRCKIIACFFLLDRSDFELRPEPNAV